MNNPLDLQDGFSNEKSLELKLEKGTSDIFKLNSYENPKLSFLTHLERPNILLAKGIKSDEYNMILVNKGALNYF